MSYSSGNGIKSSGNDIHFSSSPNGIRLKNHKKKLVGYNDKSNMLTFKLMY